MKVLEMKNITKKFVGVTALSDVSLTLDKGEIHAICGENGAGKSTLMKILSGSYPHGSFEGEIYIEDKRMKFHQTRDAEKQGVEMIYQEISLNLDLTVAENIFLGRLPKAKSGLVSWKTMRDQAAQALKLVNLDIDPGELVRSLSTSQQQLLTISKALMREPKILVLDEPTSALTEKETANLLDILKDLKRKDVSCLYISHKLEEVFEIADHITVIRDGCYISTCSSSNACTEKVIEDMVGRKVEKLYPKDCVECGLEVLRIENMVVPHPYSRNKNIIDGVSFSLKKGEVLALAGLVGSGRSELLNAIFRAYEDGIGGKVYINGEEVSGKNPRAMKEAGIGYVTEDRKKSGFVGTMDIRHNSTLASLKKISNGMLLSRRIENAEAKIFFDKLNVKAPDVSTNVLKLSGGNQQKVVLAKWLMTNLKVLLLDEPTRGIDVGAKAEIYKLMNELTAQGIGIIMVSSEMPELLAMSDRFLVLSDGKIRAEFSKDEVSQEKIMKAATILNN